MEALQKQPEGQLGVGEPHRQLGLPKKYGASIPVKAAIAVGKNHKVWLMMKTAATVNIISISSDRI